MYLGTSIPAACEPGKSCNLNNECVGGDRDFAGFINYDQSKISWDFTVFSQFWQYLARQKMENL